jgi:hypothetical protein
MSWFCVLRRQKPTDSTWSAGPHTSESFSENMVPDQNTLHLLSLDIDLAWDPQSLTSILRTDGDEVVGLCMDPTALRMKWRAIHNGCPKRFTTRCLHTYLVL